MEMLGADLAATVRIRNGWMKFRVCLSFLISRAPPLESSVYQLCQKQHEGRRSVGRPRRTWLDSVEADMAEYEIDKEDVHDRKKWRRNVMKRQSNHIEKRTINR